MVRLPAPPIVPLRLRLPMPLTVRLLVSVSGAPMVKPLAEAARKESADEARHKK